MAHSGTQIGGFKAFNDLIPGIVPISGWPDSPVKVRFGLRVIRVL
jgi:hypothetical protein